METDFPALEDEVNAAFAALEAPAAPAAGGLSFGVEEAAEAPGLARLRQLASEAVSAPPETALSFGVEQILSPLQQAEAEFAAFLENLQNELRFLANLNSSAGGNLLAQTIMRWKGDTLTVLAAEISAQQTQAHAQALSKHLKRKLLALRLITLLLAMAARVTLLTGLSGPLAWLTAYRQLKEVSALWREAAQTFL
ncbi:MAG: hypothetical protein OHK0031_05080 [Anaerolineales bacterium]